MQAALVMKIVSAFLSPTAYSASTDEVIPPIGEINEYLLLSVIIEASHSYL